MTTRRGCSVAVRETCRHVSLPLGRVALFILRSDIMNDTTDLTAVDHPTLETVLEQFITAVQTTTDDPAGTYTVPTRDSEKPAYSVEITAQPSVDDTGQTPTTRVSYCRECEWRVSTADYSSQEVSSQAVEHAVETGHDIESADRVDMTGLDGSDRPDSDAASDGYGP